MDFSDYLIKPSTNINLSKLAYKHNLSLDKAKELYKKQFKKITDCLALYKAMLYIEENIKVKLKVNNLTNVLIILEKILNDKEVKAFNFKPEVLLYLLTKDEFINSPILKLNNKMLSYIRNNVIVEK